MLRAVALVRVVLILLWNYLTPKYLRFVVNNKPHGLYVWGGGRVRDDAIHLCWKVLVIYLRGVSELLAHKMQLLLLSMDYLGSEGGA